MTDLDPEIWNNPTLGAAAQNVRLDQLEKQQWEDRNAKIEGREPREIVVENNYPGWIAPTSERTGTVPSNYDPVHFADERQNDIPVDSAPFEDSAGSLPDEDDETDSGAEESPEEVEDDSLETETVSSPVDEPSDEAGTVEPDSNEEGNSTKWT